MLLNSNTKGKMYKKRGSKRVQWKKTKKNLNRCAVLNIFNGN